MRPRTSFRIAASAARSASESVSNGKRAAYGSSATNPPFSATTRRREASSRRRISQNKHSALPLLGVRTHALPLFENPEGHDRDPDDLRVRVRVGRAGSFAMVLEDLDVLDPTVRGEVVISLAVCAEHQFDLAIVQRREVSLMVRGLDHDLVRPDAVDAQERPVPMLSDLADPFECGELLGTQRIDQPGPSRCPRSRYARDLRWRYRLVALAERAALLRRRILRIPEGTGPLGTGRGEHDPVGVA